MRNILLALTLLTVGCGRELNLSEPVKKSFSLDENKDALSIDPSEFSTKATSFSMFFLPEEKELTWKSNLYDASDDYATKIARIMKHIIKNSDEFDKVDVATIALYKKLGPWDEKYDSLSCDFIDLDMGLKADPEVEENPEPHGGSPRDLSTNVDPNTVENLTCEEIDLVRAKITAEATKELNLPEGTVWEVYKQSLIEEIQSSVDEYDRLNPDLNRPKNWMLYGDAPLYEIEPIEWLALALDSKTNRIRSVPKQTLKIVFPNLGPFGSQNFYSSETGDIYDIKVEESPYNSKIELLKFKIKEKDHEGKYTSLIWEFTLERSFVAAKLRYKGDILKVDGAGNVLRRGILKIDFAKKGS